MHLYQAPKLLSSFQEDFQNLHNMLCTSPLAILSFLEQYLLHGDVPHSIESVHLNHHALTEKSEQR